jgi:hypothetical protein
MKKYIIVLIFIVFSDRLSAQKLYTSFFLGGSNYQGDLQESIFLPQTAKLVTGFGFNFECTNRIFTNLVFFSGKLYANDHFSKKNFQRNLSFNSNIYEFDLEFEYNLFDLYEHNATPFVYIGVGYFAFDPYVDLGTDGSRVFLSNLSTEGQGFIAGKKNYSLSSWCIPFGGGVQIFLTKKMRLKYSFGMRITNTDYLDDVSDKYVDKDLLLRNRGQIAVDMAYKGNQLFNGANYPQAGTIRGNPKNKDFYYFSGLTCSFLLDAKGRDKTMKYRKVKHIYNCPKF